MTPREELTTAVQTAVGASPLPPAPVSPAPVEVLVGPVTGESVLARVRAGLPEFTGALQRVAELILTDPAAAALLDLGEIERAAEAIARANRVDIYGQGGSALVGGEMQFCLHRIGVAAWAWTDVHNGLASAALLKGGDVALGVSHSGQARETIEMIAEASSRGATTIALTSFPRSPLAEVADIVLSPRRRRPPSGPTLS